MLQTCFLKEKEVNQRMLLKIVTSLRFLARQGLPLRGDGDERNGNFNQLLNFQEEEDSELLHWVKAQS